MLLSHDAPTHSVFSEFLDTPTGIFDADYGILLLGLAVILIVVILGAWVIPNERYRIKSESVREYVGDTSSFLTTPPVRTVPPVSNDQGPALQPIELRHFTPGALRQFRVVNPWADPGLASSRWESEDCYVCLQPEVITQLNLETGLSVHRVQVDQRPPLYAYILSRQAIPPFEIKWEQDGTPVDASVEGKGLAPDGLAVGFNHSAIRQLKISDGEIVDVVINPIHGLRSIAYALKASRFRGHHVNSPAADALDGAVRAQS